MVIQGPPGTGKSQTITSLISDFVNRDKTVLMVSEKKTALDVVYSRLGTLSRFALLIDDVGNKDAFYRQLSQMTGLGGQPASGPDLSALSGRIDSLVAGLDAIDSALHTPSPLGIEPYKLYIMSRKVDQTDQAEYTRSWKINRNRDARLLQFPYAVLEQSRGHFADPAAAAGLERFFALQKEFPWLDAVRPGLVEFDIRDLCARLTELQETVRAWKAKSFFARLFGKRKVTRQARQLLRQYFINSGKPLVKLITEQTDNVFAGLGNYVPYQENRSYLDGLTAEDHVYLRSLLAIGDEFENSLTRANEALFNELLCEHIGKFEAEHRSLFRDIEQFDTVIRAISEAIDEKKKLTRQRLEQILSGGMDHLTASKRRGDILRVLESKRKWSVNKFIEKFSFELFKSVKIWLLTPEVVSEILPLQTGLFDLVVFDEASQMYVEKGIPAIIRAKKVVIAGDHKQLRPSNLGAGRIETDTEDLPEDTELSAALEEESLLDLARFKYRDVLLNFHYRSKYEELIAFSNYAFYKGRLHVSPNVQKPERPPIEVHKMENALWERRSNRAEAAYIVEMLKQFFLTRKEEETVGVISFNSSQRDLIEDLLDDECAKDPQFAASVRNEVARRKEGEDIGLFIKNIESVQGDERDVIIFSIGYAKNESGRLIRNFGWLNQRGGENRLNVAISRAKKKVHIVTSFNPAELQVDDVKNDGPRILKKYLEYAFAISSGDAESARQILLSFVDSRDTARTAGADSAFSEQILTALTEQGCEVERNVGIGGYTIPLAVKKEGRYVLGIECDGGPNAGCCSAREKDYHRQKYLEARGWRIYRVWSANWWKDPKGEADRLRAAAEAMP